MLSPPAKAADLLVGPQRRGSTCSQRQICCSGPPRNACRPSCLPNIHRGSNNKIILLIFSINIHQCVWVPYRYRYWVGGTVPVGTKPQNILQYRTYRTYPPTEKIQKNEIPSLRIRNQHWGKSRIRIYVGTYSYLGSKWIRRSAELIVHFPQRATNGTDHQ